MNGKKRIFKSLNCPACDRPFSKANGPRAPVVTRCAGNYLICRDCYDSASSVPVESREHRADCTDEMCMRWKEPAHFLNELLSNKALTLNGDASGWILEKEIELPACPVSHKSYSLLEQGLAPYALVYCGHAISHETLWRLRCEQSIFECPQCKSTFHYAEETSENTLIDFLRELPAMIEQLHALRACEDCDDRFSFMEMFHCRHCNKKLCSLCGLRNHKDHQIVDLFVLEAKATMSCKVGKYDTLFPELSKEINEKTSLFRKKIMTSLQTLKEIDFAEAKEKHDRARQLCVRLESLSGRYLQDMRAYQTGLQQLLRSSRSKQ